MWIIITAAWSDNEMIEMNSKLKNFRSIFWKRSTLFKSLIILIFITIFFIPCVTAQLQAQPGEGDKKTEKTIKKVDEHEKKEHKKGDDGHHGELPAIWSVIPFVIMLLCIAILPMVAGHWWHNNWNKLIVSMVLGIPVAAYLVIIGHWHKLMHQIVYDYVPFIALLGALFYISGGIVLRGDIRATPVNNTIFIAVGSVLASFIGTTGASMVLIRPLLRTNSERKHVMHTVLFFIFCVSNIGGLLTPLGDPPLFLGYLQGVPFAWTFKLTPAWAFTIIILLIVYYFWDSMALKKESPDALEMDDTQIAPLSMAGQRNFFWLLGMVLTVALVNDKTPPFTLAVENGLISPNNLKLVQVLFMMLLIFLSLKFTPKELREENKFTLHPIQEVAFLFIGIFMTMIPALILLETKGKALGVTEPWQYFIATGAFSSFLDNAPTYLVFLALAKGQLVPPIGQGELAGFVLATRSASTQIILAGISLGAVFMGANTYIGNAPNFMVKSIAEEQGIDMPSFGKYMLYSFGILIPVFALVIFIFLIQWPQILVGSM